MDLRWDIFLGTYYYWRLIKGVPLVRAWACTFRVFDADVRVLCAPPCTQPDSPTKTEQDTATTHLSYNPQPHKT